MKKMWIIAALAASAGALPAVAEAATAFSTANVNMRSGPSTRYPAVIVVPAGTRVNIQGCMSSANWCDVSFAGYRGWVSGSYLQTTYSQRRVAVGPRYYRPLGIPTVTFSIGRYWDDHYRGRAFYRDRDRWRDGDGWRDDRRDRDRDRRVDNDRRGRDDDRRVRRDIERQDEPGRLPLRSMMRERCERDPSACR
ncbi:SH3 domain-containing protein [Rhizobium sp. TH135]|uniref:SH3 domain-containing protein n=1 Tax=Rhizobium sp. TH135 TaxID=2067451 RepID=UPI000C7AD648|nr:SH3 domain-containing protein [Rhizobium sp. TH135]PLK69795.1 SH3 domain-containing protein [Rhizobium sp. TH135]